MKIYSATIIYRPTTYDIKMELEELCGVVNASTIYWTSDNLHALPYEVAGHRKGRYIQIQFATDLESDVDVSNAIKQYDNNNILKFLVIPATLDEQAKLIESHNYEIIKIKDIKKVVDAQDVMLGLDSYVNTNNNNKKGENNNA